MSNELDADKYNKVSFFDDEGHFDPYYYSSGGPSSAEIIDNSVGNIITNSARPVTRALFAKNVLSDAHKAGLKKLYDSAKQVYDIQTNGMSAAKNVALGITGNATKNIFKAASIPFAVEMAYATPHAVMSAMDGNSYEENPYAQEAVNAATNMGGYMGAMKLIESGHPVLGGLVSAGNWALENYGKDLLDWYYSDEEEN